MFQSRRPVAKKSHLQQQTLNICKFSTFKEEDGTIRVKGRLKHSNLDYNAKHPILLIAKHPVVQLLLKKAHRENLHEGPEYVRNVFQPEYWIKSSD